MAWPSSSPAPAASPAGAAAPASPVPSHAALADAPHADEQPQRPWPPELSSPALLHDGQAEVFEQQRGQRVEDGQEVVEMEWKVRDGLVWTA